MLTVAAFVGLAPATILWAAVMTFGAATIRGLTGFGMAIILVPLLGMIIQPAEAVILAILLQFLIGPVGLKMILADADRDSALLIAGCAVVATPLGLWLLKQTPPDLARVLIAAIAIGAFILIIAARKAVMQPGRSMTVLTGLTAGILTGFAAMPGPPVVPYYLREAFTPQTARASMMLVFFATATAGTLSAFAVGAATVRMLMLGATLFLPMLVGNHLGGLGFGRISAPLWRSLVALLLGGAGVSAVLRLF